MRRVSKFAFALVAIVSFAGCQVRSLKIVGKDEGRLRTEDFVGTWVDIEDGKVRDTFVMSGVTARPAVLLTHDCKGEDSLVVELASSQGLNFFNIIELHPKKEEFAWTTFDRVGDTIELHHPGSEFFAEAVKKKRLRGKVDSTGGVVLNERSETVVSFLRRNRNAPGLFDKEFRMRLVKLPGGCAVR